MAMTKQQIIDKARKDRKIKADKALRDIKRRGQKTKKAGGQMARGRKKK